MWAKRLVVVALVSACGAEAVRADELTCQEPFSKTSDHTRLVAAFGPGNVASETIYGPEGATFKASVIFPKDPARRVEIVWWDEKARKRPARIRVEGSGWTGPGNMRVGMPLQGATEMNGRPFGIYGFGWDYSGTVTDWKGGRLAKIPGGCTLFVQFESDEQAPEAELLKVSGDQEFTSSDAAIIAVKPKVKSFGIGYPQR